MCSFFTFYFNFFFFFFAGLHFHKILLSRWNPYFIKRFILSRFFNRKSINPNLGGLFRGSFCDGGGVGGVKLPTHHDRHLHHQKLEIWYVSSHTHLFLEHIPFSTTICLILLASAFFAKNQDFLDKNSTFTQNNSMEAVLEVL